MSGPDPAAWGILHGHQAIGGRWVPAPPAGVAAALSAMHADSAGPPPTRTWVVRADEVVRLPAPAVLVTEEGGRQRVEGALPPVPLGYHRLEFDDGPVRLIVSPGQCPLPAGRGWGWSMQLYATRSSQSWGMGDLADLAVLGRWAASQGASLVLINPLHAVAPGAAQQASPYFPSSRRWRNPLYLRVEDVPGAAALGPALGVLAEAGQALNWSRLIDRSRVWELKHDALSRIWAARTGDDGRLARWVADAGSSLATFATHAALAEEHGSDWREWPAQFRRPGDPAVARFAGGPGADRVMFHGWLQWLLDAQLAAAAAALPIVADLAIGADPGGADAWEWQDVQAGGVTVGAPPDDFSPLGQDWGFPPFDPWRLRSAGYQPWIELVRAALSRAGGLRID
ncbi:MAG TPA: 4-alpha-glucanotransferase, partial [Acidimicrobiales bacterium]|nr:4-alpha-glucanotransferase [Acidimicrobiales bacterium]